MAPPTLALVAVAAAVALLPNAAAAQEVVRGVVVEAGSGMPIEGAMVVLLDGSTPAARVLTGADGSFILRAPGPGRYDLRVDRIGYSSALTGVFDLPPGQTVVRRLEAPLHPVSLRGLEVVSTERCRVRSAEGVATVWEEARKALEAATWTSDRELYRMTWTRHVRELDARGGRILSEQRERRRTRTPQPFIAADPDSLATHGFVRVDDQGEVFMAPDATVLLSKPFLDGHCFSLLRRTENGATRIGLRFEPLRDRALPDVEGVLWLGEESGLLETLEFDYVNLGRGAPVVGDDAHGRLSFRALPNGTWIVDDWSILLPRLVEYQDDLGRTLRYEVRGFVEEGGSVTAVTTADDVVLSARTTALVGTVTDSLDAPLPGARVRIAGTDLDARTDDRGAFRFDDVGAGTWSIRASHPELDRFGHRGSEAVVTVERDAVRHVSLSLPSLAVTARDRCGGVGDPERAILIGRVVGPSGDPAPGVEVRTVWAHPRSGIEGSGIRADEIGSFVLCSIPRTRQVIATAFEGDLRGSAELSVGPPPSVGSVVLSLGEGAALARRVESATREVRDADRAWLESVGFTQRREHAIASVTGSEMLAVGVERLADFLEAQPRLGFYRPQGGNSELRLHAGVAPNSELDGRAGCAPEVYLNGSRVRYRGDREWGPGGLPETLRARDLTAAELFDGATSPVGPVDACGALLLWIARLRHPDDPPFTGTVHGRLTGLPDAPGERPRVELLPPGRETEVDGRGYFDFGATAPGPYTVEASLPGWGAISLPIDVRAGSSVEVTLAPGGASDPAPTGSRAIEAGIAPGDTIELAPIDVAVRAGAPLLESVGFFERRELTTGFFMTRAEIDDDLRLNTSDILARAPGVQLSYGITGAAPRVMFRAGVAARARSDRSCWPMIYVDGLPVQQGGMSDQRYPPVLYDLESIRPENIIGLEVYGSPAEVPAQFTGGSAACGVIVVWTR